MDALISELENGLKSQLSSLLEEARNQEQQLFRNKEGCLKIQGALEILEILKQKQVEQANEEVKEELTVAKVD